VTTESTPDPEMREVPGREPTYLGDGVYATFDGYHVVLTADGTKTIYLDLGVYRSLVKFAEANGFGGER
jgi:hypothetical protein